VDRAELEWKDTMQFGPIGILNEEGAATGPPPVAPLTQMRLPSKASAPRHKRQYRNMIPCAAEVAMCDSYSATLDALRDRKEDHVLVRAHAEETCLDCRLARNGKRPTTWSAFRFTMRGRLQIDAGIWTCNNGHVVHYDGAEDGLFATSPETVHVRAFSEAVLGICVISQSTMAATAEYLTSLCEAGGKCVDALLYSRPV